MAKKTTKKPTLLQWAAIVLIPLFMIGLVAFLLLVPKSYPIRYIWLVDAPTPLVVIHERDSGYDSSRDDAYLLRVVEQNSGIERGMLDTGDGRDGHRPSLYGPMGTKAWLYSRKKGLRLLDLKTASIAMTREQVLQRIGPQIGGDLRIEDTNNCFDYRDKRLWITGQNGKRWLLTPEFEVEPRSPKNTLYPPYDACKGPLKQLKKNNHMIKPKLRACFGEGDSLRGLVQHASADFGDTTYSATLFDSAGKLLWTKEVAGLIGQQYGWFAGAGPREGTLNVFIASGRKLWRVGVEPTTGAVQNTRELK